jgi:putative transposase
MNIIADDIYHIYNQGNNQETIFYTSEDYIEFLTIFRRFVQPHCSVLAYCLIPNHFHFLIHTTDDSAKGKRIGNIDSCELSNGFRLLQSSYAQFINKKYNRSGSLFRQKAKAKVTSEGTADYHAVAFHYIHQNPLRAGLVKRLEDWPYSSFTDYAGIRRGSLCNQLLAEERIGFNHNDFIRQSYEEIDPELVQHIYDKRDWDKLSQLANRRSQPVGDLSPSVGNLSSSVGTEGQTDCVRNNI